MTPSCRASWSRMLPKLAKRVLRLITRVSRSESIGGLVTWLKFWRKKWLSDRARRLMTASGVSSPMLPTASLASSTIGPSSSSMSSAVSPAATWRRRSSPRSNAGPGCGASWPGRSAKVAKCSTHSPYGAAAAMRSLTARSV